MKLGGTPRFPYPKTIYYFSGGYWNNKPYNCQRNGFIVQCLLAATLTTVFYISTRLERRVTPPHKDAHTVPTQALSKHKLEDDPYYLIRKEQKKIEKKQHQSAHH
ncbi:hypothetical protein DLAC_06113 [Tieghemostelium lacteum]|uniref:Uncharacterized protein n=1 Tax=Tieghemostelium lacteum TaxID=361077 RepID=A0A151ZHV2_TIELA|nr:hypothetical protein DLAC_06113 [Tieghemostelium lacteum]|eukprot:KYQ93424.1 hypothetical protein DLAC_06113 [Tieghemostelium lacteum]